MSQSSLNTIAKFGLVLLLAATMLFGLTGCAKNESDDTPALSACAPCMNKHWNKVKNMEKLQKLFPNGIIRQRC
jgi:hypothetical protein